MADDAGNNREQQQRELEEIRRSFEQIGIKMGSLFEPAQPNGNSAGQAALPAPDTAVQPAPAKGRPAWAPTWVLALGVVACLQTAKRGDEMIALFTNNVRDRRLSLALKAYTLASQACRKEASP